jgi:hypothetical protein
MNSLTQAGLDCFWLKITYFKHNGLAHIKHIYNINTKYFVKLYSYVLGK